jgi:hypothetical protein
LAPTRFLSPCRAQSNSSCSCNHKGKNNWSCPWPQDLKM